MTVPTVPDDANIDCPFQTVDRGYIVCGAADFEFSANATDQVTEYFCYTCEAGKIYREVGCNHLSPGMCIIGSRSLNGRRPLFHSNRLFCSKRKRTTAYKECQDCSLVSSPETQRIYKEALTFLEAAGFESTKQFLESAYRELTADSNYDGCIRASVSSLESTLKHTLDVLGVTYPQKETVTDLWKSVREELHLGDEIASPLIKQVIGSLAGAVAGLGGIRNELSDAHGNGVITPETYESYAELALNLSASLSTFVLRRYLEQRSQD